MTNPPATLVAELGLKPRREFYTHIGGDTPQALVSLVAEEIAACRHDLALPSGAEFLGALNTRLAAGVDLTGWNAPADSPKERFGDPREGCSKQERAHGLAHPVNTYAMRSRWRAKPRPISLSLIAIRVFQWRWRWRARRSAWPRHACYRDHDG